MASISGNLRDQTGHGRAISGAEVISTNTGTNALWRIKSEANGDYLFSALPVGFYAVTISVPGFRKYVRSGIVLEVSRNARVDVVLEVGVIAEAVTIVADAPQLNLENAQLGRTVENAEVTLLPLVNRDIYALLSLTPGVELNATANTVGFRQTTAAINGSGDGGTGSVSYYLDGGSNMTGLRNTGNATPNPDAVQEFRAITNGYSAEFGRFTAGVVDVITKSGSNAFHGSLFEFLRNDVPQNANDWGSLNKPSQRRNQFGGSEGGRILRDRLFFFGSYSGLRQRLQDLPTGAVVPTSLERSGDFSASAKKPSGVGIASALISPAAIDPTAAKILSAYIPAANSPGNQWQGLAPRPSNSDDVNFKIDYFLSKQHQLTGSYFYTKGFEYQKTGGNILWSQQDYDWKQQNFNIGETWSLNPHALNQFHLTYVRNFGGRLNLPDLSLADLGSKFTIPRREVASANHGERILQSVRSDSRAGCRQQLLRRSRHGFSAEGTALLEAWLGVVAREIRAGHFAQ